MKYVKLFEEFVAESADVKLAPNNQSLNEVDIHMSLRAIVLIGWILSTLAIFGIAGEAIDGIKRQVQKLKDLKDKRKISKDSIEDIVNEIEGVLDQLPAGKKRFMKGLLTKLKSTVDNEGNVNKDDALYLKREVDKYATQYGISKTM
jgi:hypothetical protein